MIKLEAVLTDEAAFAAAFDAIKSMKATELKKLCRGFTGYTAKSKTDALQRIWDRHANLLAAGARALAYGNRTAA